MSRLDIAGVTFNLGFIGLCVSYQWHTVLILYTVATGISLALRLKESA